MIDRPRTAVAETSPNSLLHPSQPVYCCRMRALLITFAAVFVVTFLAAPAMGGGWYWDLGNGLGFAAFAGLLYLCISSIRRVDLRRHQAVGYAVLAIATGHAFWFLLGDAAMSEFVKVGAPDYMWHGIVSLLLLAFLIAVALVPDRFRMHRDYPSFRYWHRVAALATIATGTYHITASAFYLSAWYQTLLFAGFALAAALSRVWWPPALYSPTVKTPHYLLVTVVATLLFATIRNLSS